MNNLAVSFKLLIEQKVEPRDLRTGSALHEKSVYKICWERKGNKDDHFLMKIVNFINVTNLEQNRTKTNKRQ